jgi:hypothetical protein
LIDLSLKDDLPMSLLVVALSSESRRAASFEVHIGCQMIDECHFRDGRATPDLGSRHYEGPERVPFAT